MLTWNKNTSYVNEDGQRYAVVQNPTRRQVADLTKRADYDGLRAILDMANDRLYVWVSAMADHGQTAAQLGLDRNEMVYLDVWRNHVINLAEPVGTVSTRYSQAVAQAVSGQASFLHAFGEVSVGQPFRYSWGHHEIVAAGPQTARNMGGGIAEALAEGFVELLGSICNSFGRLIAQPEFKHGANRAMS